MVRRFCPDVKRGCIGEACICCRLHKGDIEQEHWWNEYKVLNYRLYCDKYEEYISEEKIKV